MTVSNLIKPRPAKRVIEKLKTLSKGIAEIKNLVNAAEFEKTTIDTLYIVDETNRQVTLSIQVGDEGQTSSTTITLDNATLVSNHIGNFPTTSLGTNQELNGKKLSIVANVADTSSNTNHTSLTIRMAGGSNDNTIPLAKTVDENGESEDYLCLIEFFNPTI